jgi:diguanylate cyclase (GGDEF)-like protein
LSRAGAWKAATLWVVCLWLGCVAGAMAQATQRAIAEPRVITQYVQRALTDKNGLPQNSVGAIAQTPDGYLWFGTEEGIARYDGVRVTVFDTLHHPELKDNYMEALTAGRDGSLWVATRTGLTRLKHGVFTSYLTARSPLSSLKETPDGRLWAGTLEGLYALDMAHAGTQPRLYTHADGLPANGVNALALGSDGTLWVGTDGGLARLKDGRFAAVSLGESEEKDFGNRARQVRALAADRSGGVWVATRDAVLHWRDGRIERAPAELAGDGRLVSALLVTEEGSVWVGYRHQGIAVLREGGVEKYGPAQGLPAEDVSALYEDRDGGVWVGLGEMGAVQLSKGLFTTLGKQEGLSEDMVWSVLEARDGSLWVGTNTKGLNHVSRDGRVQVLTAKDGIPADPIFALHEGEDGSVWVGSENEPLRRLRGGKVTVYPDPQRTGRLVSIQRLPGQGLAKGKDGHERLLVAMHQENGVAVFDPEATGDAEGHGQRFHHYAVPGLANTLAIAPDGAVWVGSDHGGVSRLRLDTGEMKTYTTADGLLTNFTLAIYVDSAGVVWAGSSRGLNRIEHGRITTYSVEQGLFYLTVGGIVEDGEGYLWMTCNKGIFKVSKKELNDYAAGRVKEIHSVVYGSAEGLRSVECNYQNDSALIRSEDGRLWFATVAGAVSIDPRRSEVKTHAPQAQIEAVRYDQKQVNPEGGVTVGPGHGDLEIQFTAPDFVAPQRIEFRYRLEGADGEWVEAGDRRQAFYTKLSPGRYRFLVQATMGDEDWNNAGEEAQLVVLLKPQIWQTAWFRGLCLLVLIAVAVWMVRMRVRNYMERNRELEERVNERTAELQLAIRAAEAAHHALHQQASHDGLTGLWNRRSAFEMLSRELQRAEREGHTVALLLADVDHFKTVNDTHGHLVGDSVLQQVATRLDTLTRTYDFAGRYGGEEFVLVLPHCTLADAVHRAEEFRKAIAETPVPTNAGPLAVTCSIGVAASEVGMTAEELIHQADDAMYSAKRAGRNRVFASTPMGSAEALILPER